MDMEFGASIGNFYVNSIIEGGRFRFRKYPRSGEEWDFISSKIGARLPLDFIELSDALQYLHIAGLDVYIPSLEGGSFPADSPAELNLASLIGQEKERLIDLYPSPSPGKCRLLNPGGEGYEDFFLGVNSNALGLLPWGMHDSGAVCYWESKGGIDFWPVVIEFESYYWRYNMSMSEYLHRALKKEVEMNFIVHA